MTKTSITLRDLRRRIYFKAKAEESHRFWGLYVHVYKMETLATAYQMAKANKGASGIDGKTFADIEQSGVETMLLQLQEELRTESYLPQRNREVKIPKPNGKTRTLGIATIRDRVVQNALRLILEPVFEPDFQDGSFGYRPRRTPKDAIERVNNAIVCEKSRVIDLDLKNYFGTVRHHILLSKIAKRINDDQIMRVLKLILKAGGKLGVPQGGSLSPLMSNIYLNDLDKMLEKAKLVSTEKGKYTRIEYARWADDLVVLVGWHSDLNWLWKGVDRRIREELKKLEVEINEEKTKYVYLNRKGRFGFLGFNFIRKKREGKRPKSLCVPKMEARTKLFAKLREVFRRKVSRPIAEVVAQINPILRGWLNYFRTGNSSRAFSYVKRWVIEKIRRHVMRAKGRRGFGWKRWDDKELLSMHKVYSDYTIPSKRPNPYRQAILF